MKIVMAMMIDSLNDLLFNSFWRDGVKSRVRVGES